MTTTSQPRTQEPSGLARYVPILDWAPRYKQQWLRPDLIAGLTVAALVVPKSLGYAGIAGVPIQHGLYAAAAGAIVDAEFSPDGRRLATVTGDGAVPMPNIEVVPAGITFPETDTGQTVSETVTISNSGTDPLSLASIVAPLAPFSISSDTCQPPVDIAAGSSCSRSGCRGRSSERR